MDRNSIGLVSLTVPTTSLSARRAWIEMIDYVIDYVNDAMSLSARRAWIEIFVSAFDVLAVSGRSPQGERG